MFDYVIVGGGSAGCVVAARLAEDPDCRVLLLEAGPDAPATARVPAIASRLFRGRYDWNYVTLPQERAEGRPVYWPAGKMLGGSSALSALVYLRGNRADYDALARRLRLLRLGLPGPAAVLPAGRGQRARGRAVPRRRRALPVRDPRRRSPPPSTSSRRRPAAAQSATTTSTGRGRTASAYQVTQRDGRRCSVADAYLAGRPANLTVLSRAFVTGLVIEGGRATGVTYQRDGVTATARAEAEVILSAGAVRTPQLLMLSGLGPADHLRERGIYVIADLPAVGANLADHPVVPVLWSTPGVKGLWRSTGNRGLARWWLTHRGPLTSGLAEAGGFARSDPGLTAPDLQWQVLPVGYRDHGLADPARRAMTVLTGLVDVASRGRVRLASRDPRHRPLVDPGYLSDVRDLNALAAGVRLAREFGAAAPLARICAAELSPGDGVQQRPRGPRLRPRGGGQRPPGGRHLRHGR